MTAAIARGEQSRAARGADRKPSILVAGDDVLIAAMLDKAFQREGFLVYLALSAGGAVELYERLPHEIDLVLMDEFATDQEGTPMLDRLRAINPAVRCCFMTAHERNEELSSQRPDFVFRKPFVLLDVVKALRHLLGSVTNP